MLHSRLETLRRQKAAAEDRDLPLSVVAKEAGVSLNALNRLKEIGDPNDRLQVSTLVALCRYFGCGVGDLLEYVGVAKEHSYAS